MYNPCFECLNRQGHSYTEECDNTCEYANIVAKLKACGGIEEVTKVMSGDSFPIVFIDKDHIDRTYRIVCAAKDGII